MTIQIRVPQMGESVTEGVIARWLKAEGDAVAADEPVVEVETDKITIEVPAPSAGVLKTRSVSEGCTVGVGQTIGEIDESAKGNGKPVRPAGGTSTSTPTPTPTATTATTSTSTTASDVPPAGPSARLEAADRGIDISRVEGSARGGRITKDDVVRAGSAPAVVEARPVPAKPVVVPAISKPRAAGEREERKPMSPLRRRVAERLVESQNTYAILTTFNEVDMSAVMQLRARYKESFEKKHGVKLGFMSFFVKAAIEALKKFPVVNASIEGNDIVYHEYYDIGVAVSTEKGLMVPVLRDADLQSMADIEKNIGLYATKAREGKITIDELTGGTFSITNGGTFGSLLSTPIVNMPQSAILGMHATKERPMVVNGQIEIRPMMYVALSYDHRIIDGREAVQFLVAIKDALEDPARLLLSV
jgi:2-oxoglutarate dehydrogenase E2 component (dihydrolipoamide succinyltransferase)